MNTDTTSTTPAAGDPRPPVVVGGSGGSGTRLLAQILQAAGLFIGPDLNHPLDNLTFTLLFKHPYRFRGGAQHAATEGPELAARFTLHERLLHGRRPATGGDWRRLVHAATDHARQRYNLLWAGARLWRAVAGHRQPIDAWGWKEPQTMFFLDHLHAHHPQGRYVLLMRNGLDMAFARHDQQFFGWADRYGLDPDDTTPRNRFDFWYRSNREAIDIGRQRFGARFLTVRLEALCLDPGSEIERLLRFARLPLPAADAALWRWPALPPSHGRHQRFDTGWIDSDVRRRLTELGFDDRLLATQPPSLDRT